jgi:REP element-mobilizing transposase RayT
MKKQGIGHQKLKQAKQTSFFKLILSHGGILRNQRQGRGARPLSTKESLHLVFKLNSHRLRHRSLRSAKGFALANRIIKKYAVHFYIKIEQLSIQNDHIHALVRTSRRSLYQNFFRVVAGQIAQQFEREGMFTAQMVTDTYDTHARIHACKVNGDKKAKSLWKYRPFTRVVRGWKAYKIVRNYIQLNEQEVTGKIPYRKERLRGLSSTEWERLWV